MLMRLTRKLPRVSPYVSLLKPPLAPPAPPSTPFCFFSTNNSESSSLTENPVAIQMINYALSLARSKKSDESYAQGQLVLEQCRSTQSDDNSKGRALLAMSTLSYERGKFVEAVNELQSIQDLSLSNIGIKVAAAEALVGLNLELDQDDSASVLAEICFQLLETSRLEVGGGYELEVLEARSKALKGLVNVVKGDIQSAESLFLGVQDHGVCSGNAALSYAEYLHGIRKFSNAKSLYQKLIEAVKEDKGFHDLPLAACNMTKDEVLLASTCGLGQLEAHSGNFGDAEDILTAALTKAEESFGSHHPKVGVVLTCLALMFRLKAAMEHSSTFLLQEGLYRRAMELLKAAPLGTEEPKIYRQDVLALAKGGYGEILIVQQNRKEEGQRMKLSAEAMWKNRRLSLAEALDTTESIPRLPVIDARTCRVL